MVPVANIVLPMDRIQAPSLQIDSDAIEPREIIPSRDTLDLSRIPLIELMRYYGASSKVSTYSRQYQKLDTILSQKYQPYTIVEAGTARAY